MKSCFRLLLVCLLLVRTGISFSQTDSLSATRKIAIFAPLYLDSAFDANYNYRYEKNFPKFINPGLEFYEGVQLALDSLGKEDADLEVFVYDTRSVTKPIAEQLKNPELDSVDMIIAYCTGQELGSFAYAGALRKIPFINVNLPIDGGVNNNPYFVMLNSSLKTHIESLYRFAQKKYALNETIVFRKKGQMENLIRTYLDDFGKTTLAVPLKLKYIELTDSFTVRQLKAVLDSNRQTLCIAGSLDENFARRLTTQLASIAKSYKLTLMGMPTFDNISRDLGKPEFKGLEIVYSTPFYNPRTDKVSMDITSYFNAKLYARPSDMVMRGYEAAWRFSKLLLKYGKDISANLTRKEFNVFREFDIQAVLNKKNTNVDYFENKKLFIVRWIDGIVKPVN